MKTLLLGHKGYLGSYLYKYLQCDVIEERMDQYYGLSKLPDVDYDLIINCIAMSDMQACQEYPDRSFQSNANIVSCFKAYYPTAKFVHFSTYYVYNTEELATEEHPLAKDSSLLYIQHKIIGETWNQDGITFRLGKLFGNPDGKQQKLTEYIINSSDTLHLDTHLFNPCSCQCVLKAIQNEDLILNQTGIFNLANVGVTTPIDYAKFILNYTGSYQDIVYKDRKPFSNYSKFAMDLSKIQQHLILDPWEKDMREYLKCLASVI